MNCPIFFGSAVLVFTLSYPGLICSQTARVPLDPAAQETPSLAHAPAKISFRLSWGYVVVVEGSIGHVQKLNLLVETGAYRSMIDQKMAHNLGLAEQRGRVNLSNKSVQTGLAVLPSLLLGPIHVESLSVLTQDLSFFQKVLGYKVDAIIGLDVLRKISFSINYRTKEMLFGPIERLTFSAPFETDTPIVTSRMETQHRPLHVVIDTVGSDLMLFQIRVHASTDVGNLGSR